MSEGGVHTIQSVVSNVPVSGFNAHMSAAAMRNVNAKVEHNDDGSVKSNLIINYLPQSMSQDEVRILFAQLGDVDNCKLVRDKATGQSLGYGFVNYIRAEDAAKAIAALNGLRIQNKTIKVSYARPSSENIKGANLYVCGLAKTVTQQELDAMFRPFGEIITSRILCDGSSKGVGFVRFDKRPDAENAIDKLNQTKTPAGDVLTVKFANAPTTATSPGNSVNGKTNGVSHHMSSNNMSVMSSSSSYRPAAIAPLIGSGMHHQRVNGRSAAGGGGPPHSMYNTQQQQQQQVHVGPIHHQNTQQGRFRYSPITSTGISSGSSMPPISLMSQQQHHHQPTLLTLTGQQPMPMQAQYVAPIITAQPQPSANRINNAMQQQAHVPVPMAGAMPNGMSIFVYNLSPDTEDNTLWQMFGPFGAVQTVKVIRDLATNKCKGYGFVTMTQYDDASRAIAALNGTSLHGRQLQVSFKQQNQNSRR